MTNQATNIQKIRRMHAKARAYMESDPEVSLMLARKTAEAICKTVFIEKIGPNADNLMLDKLIEKLTAEKLVPKHVLTHLRTIQVHGNYGSHDQGGQEGEVDKQYVLPCIHSLDYCYTWLIQHFVPHLILKGPITIKDLALLLDLKAFQLIGDLMALDIFFNQNQTIEPDLAIGLAKKHGWCGPVLDGLKSLEMIIHKRQCS